MKSPVAFPEFAVVEEKIREAVSDVRLLAPRQIDDIFRPSPPGSDYMPSAFFLLACRTCGVSSGGVLEFACALRSYALAFKALIGLVVGNGVDAPPPLDHEHEEGMTLLISDGFILVAHGYLADLYKTELRRLVPVLAKRPKEWIAMVESMNDRVEGYADIQRSLAGTAVQAVKELVGNGVKSIGLIERVRDETDRFLTAYRKAGSESKRRMVVRAIRALSDSMIDVDERSEPLARYLSLLRGSLSATSSR